MGLDPITMGIVLGGVTAGVSAYSTMEQNRAVRRAGDIREASLKVESDAKMAELARQSRQANQRGRASFGSRGVVSGEGTAADTEISNLNTALESSSNIRMSEYLGIAETRASTAAALQNPFTNALMGGIQGFSTGYSLGSTFNNQPKNDPLELQTVSMRV